MPHDRKHHKRPQEAQYGGVDLHAGLQRGEQAGKQFQDAQQAKQLEHAQQAQNAVDGVNAAATGRVGQAAQEPVHGKGGQQVGHEPAPSVRLPDLRMRRGCVRLSVVVRG